MDSNPPWGLGCIRTAANGGNCWSHKCEILNKLLFTTRFGEINFTYESSTDSSILITFINRQHNMLLESMAAGRYTIRAHCSHITLDYNLILWMCKSWIKINIQESARIEVFISMAAFMMWLTVDYPHHRRLSGLISPHGANSDYEFNRKTLALWFWFSPAQLPIKKLSRKLSRKPPRLMEHFIGKPWWLSLQNPDASAVKNKSLVIFCHLSLLYFHLHFCKNASLERQSCPLVWKRPVFSQ